MKTFTALAAVLLLAALPLTAVNAARFEHGDIVTVSDREYVPQNVYLAGGQVTFSSTAQKDLIVAGGKVLQNGVVWGDALLAGGTVDMVQDVRGDVRVAGGQVTLQGIIGGDVIVAGGTVSVLPGTTIAGDLVAAGGAILMEGAVNGETKIYGGDVKINGTLAGGGYILGNQKVTFGEKTVVGKELTYRAPEEATIDDGAKLGEFVTFTELMVPKVDRGTIGAIFLGIMTAIFIIKLISFAFTSALVASLFTDVSRRVVEDAFGRFWHMLLVGFGVLVVTPIVGIVLVLTVLGSYIGFLLLSLYGLVLLAAGIYLCIATGALVTKLLKWGIVIDWKWAVVGTVLVSFVSLIPVVGWLAVAVLYLAVVGSIGTHTYSAIKARLS